MRIASRRILYRMLFYSLFFFLFLLGFMFVLTKVGSIDDENKCSNTGCLGRKLGPKVMGKSLESAVPEEIYRILGQAYDKDELKGKSDIPETLEEFMTEMNEGGYDAKTFAMKLREMVTFMERTTRTAQIEKYKYRYVALNSIPRQLHCLDLRLANEHANNAAVRHLLPSEELIPALVDNSYFHFVLATDNVLAASVVAKSLVHHSLQPRKVVLHIITDRMTYYPMQAWFSLHPLSPAIIEVVALLNFDRFTKKEAHVEETMEKDQTVRSRYRGGSSAIIANTYEKPNVIAAKLKVLAPKYISVMNHIRIHLPELFPNLDKVVFFDDDIVVQTDLSPLWDIDMNGKVNGAVETCKGEDTLVMSKTLESYLNFSHPLISNNFDPNECAWAYGMNIFDLKAWRKTNTSNTYLFWVEQNTKSDLSLWHLGTLPPGLIAFRGNVHTIDPFWHMLGLGCQEITSLADAKSAGVVHFNGMAKPWLDIAYPKLKPLWTKHVDFSDDFIKSCHIMAS
ncbi:putative galacturonosyltransferase [Trifolium repens]|nr:putative galacturonosyltransferase [Trifolium repens]